MTERGLPIVDGAPACPFVAFEDDRDERATSPDHRHRCYAEAQPAPRALAHQEAYCLSSAFPVCPTFQDWARREAARARPLETPLTDDADEADLPPIVSDRPPRRTGPHTWSAPPPWMRGTPPTVAPGASPPDAGAGDLGVAGVAGVAGAAVAGGLAGSFADRLASHQDGPSGGPPEWEEREAWEDEVEPRPAPTRDAGPGATAAGAAGAAAAAAGGGAAGTHRGGGPTDEDGPPRARRREHERIDPGRDEDAREHDAWAPSWERPRRLEAYPTLRSRGLPALVLPPLLVALMAILLAGAALFFLPSLLGFGGPPAGASPTPSAGGSAAPSIPVEPTPLAQATPTTYVVQAGDTMSKIANRFGVPLAALIAANQATIPNPDKLKIGDIVIIPVATPSALPGASTTP